MSRTPKTWLALLCLCLSSSLNAQTLAHKGWAGSGLAVDTWWQNAVFYEVDPLTFQDSDGDGYGDLKGLIARLDYLHGLGVDALIVAPFALRKADPGQPLFDSRAGSEEDFDRLQQEAAHRKMHLIVDLPLSGSRTAEDTIAAGRFWLSRGVGGLRLRQDSQGTRLQPHDWSQRVASLEKIASDFAGNRVLLFDSTDAGGAQDHAATSTHAHHSAELHLDSQLASAATYLSPSALRAIVTNERAASVALTDRTEARSADRLRTFPEASILSMEKLLATALFTGNASPLVLYGQELGMTAPSGNPIPMQWGTAAPFSHGKSWLDEGPSASTLNVAAEENDPASLLHWYRILSDLRHTIPALRGTQLQWLDTGYPQIAAWLRRSPHPREPNVLILSNLSSQPLILSLVEPLRTLGLPSGVTLHPLAASSGPSLATNTTITALNLPAYSSYLGELRQPGLEASSSPRRRSRSHRRSQS